jgi:hypothetical protein
MNNDTVMDETTEGRDVAWQGIAIVGVGALGSLWAFGWVGMLLSLIAAFGALVFCVGLDRTGR